MTFQLKSPQIEIGAIPGSGGMFVSVSIRALQLPWMTSQMAREFAAELEECRNRRAAQKVPFGDDIVVLIDTTGDHTKIHVQENTQADEAHATFTDSELRLVIAAIENAAWEVERSR